MPCGDVVGEVGGARMKDQPGNEVAHRLLEPAARQQGVERSPAAGLEQSKDLVARNFGKLCDTIGEEQYMPVDQSMQHHPGAHFFALHEARGIIVLWLAGLALA